MAVSLKILGWNASNLRCPDHRVSFEQEDGRPYPVTLIQMPNGTGKTTTLELLRAALSGEAAEWLTEKVLAYRKPGSKAPSGEFQVTLLYNERRLTVTLRFDFVEGALRYSTTLGSSGLTDGFHPPSGLKNYLRKDFVRFFVFDGEFADRLLDRGYANAQSVIEELFQLQHFASMEHAVKDFWEKQTRNVGATEEKGLSRRRKRVERLRERITLLERERATVQEQRDKARDALARKKKKFQDGIDAHQELAKRLRAADGRLSEAVKATETATQALFAEVRNPHALATAFADDIVRLKESLDKAKLPGSSAREFFEELAQGDECICGTLLDDGKRALVRARASRYLGSEDVTLLNAMKSDIKVFIGSDIRAHELRLQRTAAALQACNDAAAVARTARDAIQSEGVGEDPSLGSAHQEIARLEKELAKLDEQLDIYEDRDESANDETTCGIRVLQKRLKDAELKLAEVTNTLILKQKRDLLVRILKSAVDRARKAISVQLTAEANQHLLQLMPDNGVRIQEVNRFLVLEEKPGASVGETLAVAYSFISTLLTRGETRLPFIIDSPANPIDLRVRAKVASLVPHLSEQFLAFVISSERQGFVPELEAAAASGVQHITLFRKSSDALSRQAEREQQKIETKDGILVFGKSFFHRFHSDQEEE